MNVSCFPRWFCLLVGISLFGLTVSPAAAEGYIVVVNEANSAPMISESALSEIFLKKKVLWNDGTPTDPVDLPADSPARAAFSEDVHKRSVSQIKAFWQQRIFSGADTPPVEVSTAEDVMEFIRLRPGGIGYVSPDTKLVGVKQLLVVIPPVPIRKVPPVYTERAQRFRIQGEVQLRLLIGVNGKVKDVEVIEGLKHGLTESAIQAAKQWDFRPATAHGTPVEAWLDVVIAFRL